MPISAARLTPMRVREETPSLWIFSRTRVRGAGAIPGVASFACFALTMRATSLLSLGLNVAYRVARASAP